MKTITQTVSIKAKPIDVYWALMDSEKHSEFTGATAVISKKVGGKFTAYDGYIEGRNLALSPGKKIVVQWRGGEAEWGGKYSTITLLLTPVRAGTKISFKQDNVPDSLKDSIAQGWRDFYWNPLKNYLE